LVDSNPKMTFNPFKCDMWALGICLKKIWYPNDIGDKNTEDTAVQSILNGLLEKEWKNRFYAMEFCEELSRVEKELGLENLDVGTFEKDFQIILRKTKWNGMDNQELLKIINKPLCRERNLKLKFIQCKISKKILTEK
jgi:hypothetical protein